MADIVLDVGDEVPNFNLDSQMGMISFREIIDGRWCLLVTIGQAFDAVATTDVAMVCKLYDEFESRNILPLVVGNDSVSNYRRWINDIEDIQSTKVKVALMADTQCKVLAKFGCARVSPVLNELIPTNIGVFLVDIDKRIRISMRYSPLTGRNFYEIIRSYDALQMVTLHKVVCPSNWGQGQDVMLQKEITEEEENNYRFVEVRNWFKLTPSPEM